jgi:hypothetical protein
MARGPGRIRLSQVADYSAASLHGFIAVNLAPAAAKTDGWSGYPGAAGITHEPMSSVRWPLTLCCPGPPDLFQPQGLGLGHLSWVTPPAPPILPR